jgi:Flp pilus assembly protein TadG
MTVTYFSRRDGQAVVEMTFGFLLFFTMFMAIVEFSHLLYAKVTLQHALRTAGRYMVTGRTEQNQQGINRPRDEVIRDVFCANLIAAGVRCPALNTPNFQFTCVGGPCTAPGGGPTQTVSVTVRVVKPTLMPFFARFFPNGGVPLNIGTTWKNEPFPT